ncbi:MAG TPA: M1 family metallopeptidase [Desulfobacterales bacterium]
MDDFTPDHYHLRLTPDLQRFRFSGELEIEGHLSDGADTIRLNILDLAIWQCEIRSGEQRTVCPFTVDTEREELRIHLPQATSGALTIFIVYEGSINNRMAGFYRSGYRQNGEIRYIAVTQFQESDARRAFPCQDYPRSKATFDVELVVDESLTALSNNPAEFEEPIGDGKKRVRFRRTPKMSTYLLFFGVGDFEITEDETDRRVRAVTVPGRKAYAGYGLAFGRDALGYCDAYYGIDYPLDKMDLIAIPDFAFGAMENWGAITFRENLLLHYPGVTSRAGEERICEVIAHEIAHQWFGNLVTPSDWKYLWLNESFATFFGFGVVDHFHPEWGIWQQFIAGQTESALNRDSLRANFAIEIPGGEHVVINTSTAPIIYSKGASILRQVRGYIGETRFQEGLRRYLKTHEYGNATSRNLWEAFESASDRPVTRMMQSWIGQPGHPLVTVRREESRLQLAQERYADLPGDFDQRWEIPLNIMLIESDGRQRVIQSLMRGAHHTISLENEPVAYKINAGQTGFYRVQYLDEGNLQSLGRAAEAGSLGPEDRWGLQNDVLAMVRSGRCGVSDYLRFLNHYRRERVYLPLAGITANLHYLYLVVPAVHRQTIAETGKPILEHAIAAIGLDPAEGEAFTDSLLRDQIMVPAYLFGSSQVAEFADRRFEDLRRGRDVHPDVQKSVLQVSADRGDAALWDWLRQRFEVSDSEHERLNLLASFGCFSDWSILQSALEYTLKAVPDRNRFIPMVSASVNPAAVDHLWDWYRENLEALEHFHPLLYERVIAAVVPFGGLGREAAVRAFFDDYRQRKPQVKDVVELSLERLEINRRLRAGGM